MYEIIVYTTPMGNAPLEDFLSKLLKKEHNELEIAQIKLYIDRLAEYGFDIAKHFSKSVKHLQGDIYELRPGRNRILYFYQDKKNRFVLLHGFVKESGKTPPSEIEKAIREQKDFLRRYKND